MTYLRFCVFYEVEPVPISQKELLAYVAFLARSLKPTSIQNYLNAVRIIHLDSGFPNPLENNFALSNLKKGISRELGSPPVQKLPITCHIMHLILKNLVMFVPKDIAFWAACTTAFFGFLRKKTLLPVSSTKPDTDCLLRNDLVMQDANSYTLYIRRTKTIQFGERILVLPFVAEPSNALCPVSAMKNLMLVSPKESMIPLFSYIQRGKTQSWTHTTFVDRLRRILSDEGFNAISYSGHSFRRGGATLGFKIGLSMAQIKQRGDWRSSAVENYIFVTSEQVSEVASLLVNGAR